ETQLTKFCNYRVVTCRSIRSRGIIRSRRFFMLQRAPRSACPMDRLLRLLTGPWTTYILWVLRSNGPTRFGELKRRVPGVSAKMLTEIGRASCREGGEIW